MCYRNHFFRYISAFPPREIRWSPSLMLRVAPLPIVLLTVAFTATVLAGDPPTEFTPHGTILDRDQNPIQDARISLHCWKEDGMSPEIQMAETDADGYFEFPERPDDAPYYVVIRKVPYAAIWQKCVSTEGAAKVILRSAVDTWIQVRNAAGAPLKGARITNLSIRTQENTLTSVSRGMEHLLGWKFTASDDAGRLNLPPLPENAFIDVRIDHPLWAQEKLSNLRVSDGRLESVSLPEGVLTTFEFVADARTPMTVEGLICETMLFSESSQSAETLNRIPMTITGSQIKFCAHPVTYEIARLRATAIAITPEFARLTLAQEAEKTVRFLVRKTVNVSGRVVRRDGTPHKGVRVLGQIENLSPDGPVPGPNEWIYFGNTETDVDGKYTISLPPGHNIVSTDADGFVMDRDETKLEVQMDGPNEIPDFISDVLEPVHGQVVDESDQPVSGAVVRLPHLVSWTQPVLSDAEGRFEIPLPVIPIDHETQQRRNELDVVAFVADQPRMGVAAIDFRDSASLKNVRIVLRPDPSENSLLNAMSDDRSSAETTAGSSEQPEKKDSPGDQQQSAPELDGVAWFNTDARSLNEFRGRYVLLDFWFTNCGPCHADFPTVKLVHELFEKHGVTVIGVHDNSSTPDAIREHCQQSGLTFPMVVDHADGRIVNAYRQLGLQGFPSYFLIGPDGKILENDHDADGPPLHTFKLEVIRKYVLDRRNQRGVREIDE